MKTDTVYPFFKRSSMYLSISMIKYFPRTVSKLLFLFLVLFTYSKSIAQNIDPSSIISVEFKTGAADQGIPFYPDMLFGASASEVVAELNAMKVNTLRIPVSLPMDAERVAILVDFISKIHDNGGENMAILLSQRKWNLHLESQQEGWSDDISNAYNGIASAGFGNMVKGCIFDENTALNGAQSSVALWDLRHQGVLDAMEKLNNKTNNAFKTRTVFIHGKGYGSQFLGVKASSDGLGFASLISNQCSNYAYNFKFFQVGDPTDKSLSGWTAHYKDYCKLTEVLELGVPVMFVGDAGDGLRPDSFTEGVNPYGGPGEYVVRALRDVFAEFKWTGFSVGPFLRENATTERTILYSVVNGELIARQDQIDSWDIWYETTRPAPCDTGITTNVRINGGAWSTDTYQNLDAGGTLQFGPQSDNGPWSWTGPNGFTASTREVSITDILPSQAGAYTVTHESNDTGCISTETFNIVVNIVPCDVGITTNVRINGGAWSTDTTQSIDEGGTLQFGPQSDGGPWSWTGPNGFTASTREVSITNILPNQAGAYTVTHQSNANGCVTVETFNITVNESLASFVPDPNKTYYIDAPHYDLRLAATGESETAYTTSTSTTGADVEWKFVDKGNGFWHLDRAAGGSKPRLRSNNSINADMEPIASDGSWTYFGFSQGSLLDTYFLTLPNGPAAKRLQIDDNGAVNMVEDTNNGVSESFVITEVIALSLKNEDLLDAFSIYPNPVRNELNINVNSNDITTIILYNLNGQKVLEAKPSRKVTLDLSKLNRGVYMLTVKDKLKTSTKKIVKL